jgi:hypothetical protein
MRQIPESKRAMRQHLATRPFSEKVALQERLRDRSLAIAASLVSGMLSSVQERKSPAILRGPFEYQTVRCDQALRRRRASVPNKPRPTSKIEDGSGTTVYWSRTVSLNWAVAL